LKTTGDGGPYEAPNDRRGEKRGQVKSCKINTWVEGVSIEDKLGGGVRKEKGPE